MDNDDNNTNNEYDSVVTSVVNQYLARAEMGKKKYGQTLDREDLSLLDWIRHTQEELMDATLYLEKLKKTICDKLAHHPELVVESPSTEPSFFAHFFSTLEEFLI
jgi:succinate dehydrogenase flavin-adding protein (antitoxin of CptAB toxin-antitoxin module)